MINAGNPSAHNLKIRKYMTENRQTSSQIFEKLNRRGRLNPAQNAMSAQLTNEQLLRFYVKDTEPKLEFNNDNIQGQGGDANSVLMSEIQRLIDVGNFNAEDAKGNMNNMQTKLVTELQRGFSSIDDSVAINLSSVRDILYGVEDNLNEYLVKGGGATPIITALQDISTKLDQYNTTGNVSQSALLSSLTDLQNALLTANVSSADNTAAIEQLQIIMGSIPGIAVPSASSAPPPSGPTPAQAAAAQALLDAQNARAAAAAAAQKLLDDAAAAQKLLDDEAAAAQKLLDDAAAASTGPPPSPSSGGLSGLASAASGVASAAASGVASLLGFGTKPPPTPLTLPGVGGISTVLAPVSPTGGMGAAGGFIPGEHPDITAAKIAAGTKRDLTITQNKELLLNLYTQYPEIFADELSSIKTADPFKTWISKPDKDKSTTKNLVEELLIKKNELLADRAQKAAQAEDWRLKKIRIMKQTRDEIDSGFAPKAEKYRKEEEAKAIAAKAAKKAAKKAAAQAAAQAAAEAAAEAKTNSALAKFQAKMRGDAARKKLRSGGGAAGGAAPP
jgi:hypothetical protein